MEVDITSLRKKASLKRKKKFFSLLIILFISFGSILLISVGVFDIKSVEVYGNKSLPTQEVIKWSQIIIGQNVLKFKKSETISNLKKHPFIDSVNVNILLPNTIKITISERSNKAIISYLGSHVYIDGNANILKITQGLEKSELPLVLNMEISPPKVGNKIGFIEDSIGEIMINILQLFEQENMLDTIKTISLDQEKNILLTCSRNNQIKILNDGNIDYRIGFLKQILLYLQENDVVAGYINMMHEGNPVYSPVKNWED